MKKARISAPLVGIEPVTSSVRGGSLKRSATVPIVFLPLPQIFRIPTPSLPLVLILQVPNSHSLSVKLLQGL